MKIKEVILVILTAFCGWVLIDVDHIFSRLYFHWQYVVYLVVGLWAGILIEAIVTKCLQSTTQEHG